MSVQNFPTYLEQELKDIEVNGQTPESMTIPYSSKHVKEKRFSKNLINDKDVFVISTQKRRPVFRFRQGEKLKVTSPFFYSNTDEAVCLGEVEYMHKGYRMLGYFVQWK